VRGTRLRLGHRPARRRRDEWHGRTLERARHRYTSDRDDPPTGMGMSPRRETERRRACPRLSERRQSGDSNLFRPILWDKRGSIFSLSSSAGRIRIGVQRP
jgi:hypothetical protein